MSLWKNDEVAKYLRAEDLEVPAIDSEDGSNPKPLGDCSNYCVDKVNPAVTVFFHDLDTSFQIGGQSDFDWQFTIQYRTQKRDQWCVAKLANDHKCKFRQDYIRKNRSRLCQQYVNASLMKIIVLIQHCQQKAGIQVRGHGSRLQPSRRSATEAKVSSTRWDRSPLPLCPTPMNE